MFCVCVPLLVLFLQQKSNTRTARIRVSLKHTNANAVTEETLNKIIYHNLRKNYPQKKTIFNATGHTNLFAHDENVTLLYYYLKCSAKISAILNWTSSRFKLMFQLLSIWFFLPRRMRPKPAAIQHTQNVLCVYDCMDGPIWCTQNRTERLRESNAESLTNFQHYTDECIATDWKNETE